MQEDGLDGPPEYLSSKEMSFLMRIRYVCLFQRWLIAAARDDVLLCSSSALGRTGIVLHECRTKWVDNTRGPLGEDETTLDSRTP